MIAKRPAIYPGPRRRSALAGDDRGSIAMLLLVILVGVALCGLLVPMIITQNRTTRFDTTRVQALDAAQAGLDVMLGNIRKFTTGDSSKLPCPGSPITGTLTSSPLPGSYSVTVLYFAGNPLVAGSATFNPCASTAPIGSATPTYAQLTSTGSAYPVGTTPPAGSGVTNGRVLVSTYQFRTTNVIGGVIPILPASASSAPLCMDAGPAPYNNGYLVQMQPCSTSNPPLAQQAFIYRNDLTIQLVSSVTSGTPTGLCLTQPTGTAVSLSTCQTPGLIPPYTQQWSYNQYGAYQTVTARSAVYGSLGTQCMNLASQIPGSQLTLATCDYTAANPVQTIADPVQSWVPSRGVGAGAATLPQWSNYSDFGRCIYIPPGTTDHLWSYPCTQNPLAIAGLLGAVPLGQRFTAPPGTSGQITSANGSCLTSPTSGGGWVTAAPCSTPSLQTWTVNSGAAPSYKDKYTITNNGWCLGLGTPAYTDKWSVIQTEPCTGAADQKWNVPPNALLLSLQNAEVVPTTAPSSP